MPVNAGTYYIRAVLTNSPDGGFANLTTASKSFTIYPKQLTDELLAVIGEFMYNGMAHTPIANVTGLALEDYTVSYLNNINAGTASVVITGMGNYTGQLIANFTILPRSITAAMFSAIASVTYSGNEHTPTVSLSGAEPNVTFSVVYSNNINAGQGMAAVTGTDNYTGEVILYFTINKAIPSYILPYAIHAVYGQTLADLTLPYGWTWYEPSTAVGGERQQFPAIFTPADTDNYITVTASIDVIVSPKPVDKPTVNTGMVYDGGIHIGVNYLVTDAYALTNGETQGIEVGIYFAEFTLAPFHIWSDGSDGVLVLNWIIGTASASAEVEIDDFTFSGAYAGNPRIINSMGDWQTIVFEYSADNINWSLTAPVNAGTYHIRAILTASPDHHYADFTTASVQYVISPKVLTNELLAVQGEFVYNALPHTPSPNVSSLVQGRDYSVSYRNNVNAGTATLTIIGMANFTGELSINFTITPKPVTVEMFAPIAGVVYNALPHTPQVMRSGMEHQVTFSTVYSDNVLAGTAFVTVTGTGNFGGEVTLYFTINKAVPIFSIPTGLAAVYGQTLADVQLPEGWEWRDSPASSVGNAGLRQFWAEFTLLDDNYDTAIRLLDINVSRAPVAKPGIITGLMYTGEVQAGVLYIDGTSYAITAGVATAITVGYYSATFMLSPNYMWSDGSVDALSLEWSIAKATPDYILPTGLTAVYGQTLSNVLLPEGWAWVDSSAIPVGNVGVRQFAAIFIPDDMDDYSMVTRSVDVTVTPALVARPIVIGGLVYNGQQQSGVQYDAASVAYSLMSGTTSAGASGNYTAIFVLNSNYMWEDGTTAVLILGWHIAPAASHNCTWWWFLIGFIVGTIIIIIVWFTVIKKESGGDEVNRPVLKN
jgi:hypothetical protein